MRVNENERSHAIDLITEIEVYLRKVNLSIKSAGGESTIKNSRSIDGKIRKIMFPDVLLYSDNNKNEIIQGWEIKLPDISVEDTTYISDAQYKADALGLTSTILWNFHSVVLYVKNNDKWAIYKQWTDLFEIKDRKDVLNKRELWIEFLKEFLQDLDKYFRNGVIEKRTLAEITDSATTYIINDNKEILADFLKESSKKDLKIKSWVDSWWVETKYEFLSDETDGYIAYSKILLMSWITKIIFAHLIRNTHSVADKILEFNERTLPNEAINIFQEITEISDFYTIFEYKRFEEYVSETVWQQLLQLTFFYEDKIITHNILQKMLENSVSSYKREIIGQYTTPEQLADLLVNVTMTDVTGHDIDPCCGTGTIPKRIISKKEEVGVNELESHATVWAADKMQMALQVANMAITTPTSMNVLNQVFQKNVFKLSTDNVIEFTSPENGEKVKKVIPKFNNIISNLPFVPFEIVEETEKEYIAEIYNNVKDKSAISLSNRSDYYMYIIFKFHELLEEEGRIGVIISNSWLGTLSGTQFYEALKRFFIIDKVIISGRGKWFENADVITSILVLEKRSEKNKNNNIRFIKLNKKIHDISHSDVLGISSALLLEKNHEYLNISSYSNTEIDLLLDNKISLNSLFHNVKWINKISDILVPLTSKFDVIRGERRGWDKLFYPTDDNNIESEYIERVMKSSKNISVLGVNADGDAFCCSRSIEELERLGHNGALDWIKRFEHTVNGKGKPLVEVLARKSMNWYEMNKDTAIAEFITSINPEKRLFWAKLNQPSFINQRLIGLTRNNTSRNISRDLLMALLNSVVGLFFIEASGFGRGLGALDISKSTLEKTSILSPDLLSAKQKKYICNLYILLPKNISNDIRMQINTVERERLDRFILSCYGIEKYYEQIKSSLISMIDVRLTVKD